MSAYLAAEFPLFVPEPTSSLVTEFSRLARQQRWRLGTEEYRQRQLEYYTEAVLDEFERAFGRDPDTLDAWQKLCVKVGVVTQVQARTLHSVENCREKLNGIFVNLVDLADACRSGASPMNQRGVFKSWKGLSDYIQNTGKTFYREKAKANPLLKQFLIQLIRTKKKKNRKASRRPEPAEVS